MPLTLDTFRQAAQLDVNRLTQNAPGNDLVQAPRGFFGRIACAVTGPTATERDANKTVLQSLHQALITGYGNTIADAATGRLGTTQDLSSHTIKTVLDTATRLGHEQRLSNQASISQCITSNTALQKELQNLPCKDQRALRNQILNQLASNPGFSRKSLETNEINAIINTTVQDFQGTRHKEFQANYTNLANHYSQLFSNSNDPGTKAIKPSVENLDRTITTLTQSNDPVQKQLGDALEAAKDHLDHNIGLLSACPIGEREINNHQDKIVAQINKLLEAKENLEQKLPGLIPHLESLVKAMRNDIEAQIDRLEVQIRYLDHFKTANPISPDEIFEARQLHRATAIELIEQEIESIDSEAQKLNKNAQKIEKLTTLKASLKDQCWGEYNLTQDESLATDDEIRTRLENYPGELQRELEKAGVPNPSRLGRLFSSTPSLEERYLKTQAALLKYSPNNWNSIEKTIQFTDGNVQHTYQSHMIPALQMLPPNSRAQVPPGLQLRPFRAEVARELVQQSLPDLGVLQKEWSKTEAPKFFTQTLPVRIHPNPPPMDDFPLLQSIVTSSDSLQPHVNPNPNPDHDVPNLYASGFMNANDKVLYQGVRHAIHSAYELHTGEVRTQANLERAKRSIQVALALKPQLMQQTLAGEVVTFRTTSTSLVTPDAFRRGHSDEAQMLREQVAAFAELSNPAKQPLTLNIILDENGNTQEIKVKLEVATFNFGVNAGAVNWYSPFSGGWTQSHGVNEDGMKKLLGSTNPSHPLGGWVEAHLVEHPTDPNSRHIIELSKQIREMYDSGAHRSQEHDTYKMAARILLLTHLLEGVPLSNCKSGKDRTGMLDAEVKFLAHRLEATGEVPKPGALTPEESRIFREIAMNAGNLEIQKRSAGIGGYKTEHVDSITERIDDDKARRIVRGGSKAVKT